jgi:hypothetical protein
MIPVDPPPTHSDLLWTFGVIAGAGAKCLEPLVQLLGYHEPLGAGAGRRPRLARVEVFVCCKCSRMLEASRGRRLKSYPLPTWALPRRRHRS